MSFGQGVIASDYISVIFVDKVHIFWKGHKILQNPQQLFDWQYIGQIIGGDFAKFCGLPRIYELYKFWRWMTVRQKVP